MKKLINQTIQKESLNNFNLIFNSNNASIPYNKKLSTQGNYYD